MPSFARQLVAIARGATHPVVQVGDLTPVRDFSHVDDVIDGYLLLLERGASGEVYNVCSGQGLSIREALDVLQELAGTQAEIRVDPARLRTAEIPWLVGDPRKLENLGWGRRRLVRDALRDVLEEAQV
jgi:GDP-4-dehydro-6-deoxy-D-mannose reductase